MRTKTAKPRSYAIRLALVLLLASVACLTGAIVAVNTSPGLLLTLLGLRPACALVDALPPERVPLARRGLSLDHVDLFLPPHVDEPLTLTTADATRGRSPADPLVGDASTPGETTYLLTISEDALNGLVEEHILPEAREDTHYDNVALDLQPGGLIVYADVDLGIRRQRVGLLLLQDEGTSSLSTAGVVLDGELHAAPESGSVARWLLPTGRQAERVLYGLTVVGPLPGEARVDTIRFGGDHLQILAQATYAASTLPDTGWRALEAGLERRDIDVTVDAEQPMERLSILRLQPTEVTFRIHYDPGNPKTISAWAEALEAPLVINGSYFTPESERGSETIGLLISDGQHWGTPLEDYAGMLAVAAGGQVSVRWLRQWPYDPGEPLTQAVQSFPILVKPGGVLGFPAEADDGLPARRTVVAQDRAGNILLIVAPRGGLSLHELAVFLTESDVSIDVALNLDGGGSTGMWLALPNAQIAIDSLAPVPSVIAVEKR